MEDTMDEVGARVGESFDELRRALVQRTRELRDAVTSFVDERPLQAVGLAFGVGYLLSGALLSRTTARVVGLGGRFLAGGVLRRLVAAAGPAVLLTALGVRGGDRGDGRGSAGDGHGGFRNDGNPPEGQR
jgi:hypothetical protein